MIGLDSWVFLEYFVAGPKYRECKKLVLSKKVKVISTAVLMEVKFKATKIAGKFKAKKFLNDIKTSPTVKLIDVDRNVAEKAAELRLKYYKKGRELSYSDCIHLATAMLSKCRKFYSGDPDFKGVEEIPIGII